MLMLSRRGLIRVLQALTVVACVTRTARSQGLTVPTLSAADRPCADIGVPEALYRSVLNTQFSALLGSAQAVPGSFGSVEIDKEQKVKLAVSSQPGRGRVFSLEASGGANDGFLSYINNRESSTTFAAAINLHLLRGAGASGKKAVASSTRIEYDNASCHAYYAAARRADDSLAVRLAIVKLNGRDIARRQQVAKYAKELKSLVDTLADLKLSALERDTLRVDSAHVATLYRLAETATVATPKRQELESRTTTAAELRGAEALLKVTGFTMGWVSLTAGVQNTSFKLFDPTMPVASQLSSESYAAPRVGVSYSRYTLSKLRNSSRFWSVAANASLEDNLSSLQKIELIETRQFGATPDERVSKKTSTARQGIYDDNLAALAVTGDLYEFLFRDNQGALHLSPSVVFKEQERPTYSAGIGYLWTARKEKAAFFNVELLFTLTDITESEPSDLNVWERSRLGLRLTFPILFSPR